MRRKTGTFSLAERRRSRHSRRFTRSKWEGDLESETRGFIDGEQLKGKKIAFLATDMVEQVELTEPWKALEGAGAELELVSIKDGEIQGFNHYDKADEFKVDKTVEEASASDYDALVLPGGVGNPDTLRTDENAVVFVREFFEQGKPVGAICHAPWTLDRGGCRPRPDADVVAVAGRRTSGTQAATGSTRRSSSSTGS